MCIRDSYVQQNARQAGVYGAAVQGTRGMLYVRLGGSDASWQPAASGYGGFREYGSGQGWKVWVGLPGNPPLQQAPLARALPAPGPLQPVPASLPALCRL